MVHPCNYPIFKEGRREESKYEWEESPSYSSCFLVTSSVYEGFCHGRDSQHLHQRTLPPVPLAAWGTRWLFNTKKKIKRRTRNLVSLVAQDEFFFKLIFFLCLNPPTSILFLEFALLCYIHYGWWNVSALPIYILKIVSVHGTYSVQLLKFL